MKVFITGIAGFLGSHLAEHCLNKGFKVVGNDTLIGGDLSNLQGLDIEFYEVDCSDLKEMNTDLVVYAGGGILRKKFIRTPNIGILNAHSGHLPFFRGMNVIEWSLLYNKKPTVTVHMISEGIDTGDILFHKSIPIKKDNTILDIRGEAVVAEVESLIHVISNFDEIYKKRISQNEYSGTQFFIMHKRLVKIASKNIHSFDSSY